MNADKTEFITFQTTNKNNENKKTNLIVKDEIIRSSSTIKYLGVYLDQNLTFQEVKHTLRKMACGIKTLYSIRNYLPENVRLLLLNALVIGHLHYPTGNFIEWFNSKSQNDLRETTEMGNKSVFQSNKVRSIVRSSRSNIRSDTSFKTKQHDTSGYGKQPNPGVRRLTTGHWQNTKTIQNRDSLLQYLL